MTWPTGLTRGCCGRSNGGGLSKTLLLMHLRSVDQERLIGRYRLVSDETMRKAEAALKVATGLTPT